MSDAEEVSAKEAIEATLADRVQTETGFLERLVVDPNGTIGPIISEVLADDGALSLSDAAISVHLETDRNLHFVVSLPAAAATDEVVGFASIGDFGLVNALRIGRVPSPKGVGGSDVKYTEANLCTASGVCVCDSEDCDSIRR